MVKCKDPLVRDLLGEVAKSGLTDSAILARAGCDHTALHRLRAAKHGTTKVVTIASIAGVLGLELRLGKVGE